MQAPSRTTWWLLAGLVVLSAIPYLARPAPVLGQAEVTPESVNGGGSESQSASFLLNDTVAQGPVGPTAAGALTLLDGFWGAAVLPAAGDTVPPATVASFQAGPGDEVVRLSWINPGDEDFAKTVIRYSTVGYPGTPVAGIGVENGYGGVFEGEAAMADTFTHVGLVNGETYYYTAFAFDSSSNYSAGVIASAVPFDDDPPAAVAFFTAEGGDTTVMLRWTNPDDADFDHTLIRYSTSTYPAGPADGRAVENGAGGVFANAPASADSFVHTGLANGLTYYYAAFAADEVPNHAAGLTAAATPADEVAPSEVPAFAATGGDTTVMLRWTNPDDADFDHTLIRYSTVEYPSDPSDGLPVENGAGGRFANAPASVDSFVHTGLENGTVYYYVAFAADEVPNYSDAVGVTATPVDTVPPAPAAAFTATAVPDGTVKLRWGRPADQDVQGVHIRYSTDDYPADRGDGLYVDNGHGGMFAGGPAAADSFIQSGLTVGTMHYYSAFVYDEAGNYSERATAAVTPEDEVPPTFDISVFQNPYLTNHLDVFVIPSEAVSDTSLVVVVGGADTLEMQVTDMVRWVYRGDYDLYTTGTLSIAVSGRDLSGNPGAAERSFASTFILAGAGGVAVSGDGRCEVGIPGSAAPRDMYVLIFEAPAEDGGTVYGISPVGALDGFVEVSIEFEEGAATAEHLCIARIEGGEQVPLESYITAGGTRIAAHVDRLGSFSLLWRQDTETPSYGDGGVAVFQNIPNPFVGTTTIAFETPRMARVRIDVVCVDGRIIRNLLDETVLPGRCSVVWDGRDDGGRRAASGLYLYRVRSDSKVVTRKMILLR